MKTTIIAITLILTIGSAAFCNAREDGYSGKGWPIAARTKGKSIFSRLTRRFEVGDGNATIEIFTSVSGACAEDTADRTQAYVQQVYPELERFLGRKAKYTRKFRLFVYADAADCYQARRARGQGLTGSWYDARDSFIHLFIGEIQKGKTKARFIPNRDAVNVLQHEVTHAMLRWFYAYGKFSYFNTRSAMNNGKIPEMFNEGLAMAYQAWDCELSVAQNRARLEARKGRSCMTRHLADGRTAIRAGLWLDLKTLWTQARSRTGLSGNENNVHAIQVYQQGELFVLWLLHDPAAAGYRAEMTQRFQSGLPVSDAAFHRMEAQWKAWIRGTPAPLELAAR